MKVPFDPEVAMTESQLNQEVAEHICGTGEWNGQRFQQGEFVALLDGKIIAVASGLDHALRALRKLETDPRRGMVCEVAPPVLDVIR